MYLSLLTLSLSLSLSLSPLYHTHIGDSVTLSPEVDSNKTWWLNCSTDCEISDRVGRKFKNDDITGCPELVFEMQKINEGHRYIRVGDTVTLKQRSPTGVNVVVCSSEDKQCRTKEGCVSGGGGGGGKFDETVTCPNAFFIVGALGKSEGELISHQDSITFSIPNTNTLLEKSLFQCTVNEDDLGGQCNRLDCPLNSIIHSDMVLLSTSECTQPSTFLLKKL